MAPWSNSIQSAGPNAASRASSARVPMAHSPTRPAGQLHPDCLLGNRCDTVVGGQHDEGPGETHSTIHRIEQSTDGGVCPDGDVTHLGGTWTKRMPHGIVGREAHCEQVRLLVLPQGLAVECRLGEGKEQLVTEGTVVDLLVELGACRAGERHEGRFRRIVSGAPRSTGPRVRDPLGVECLDPGRQRLPYQLLLTKRPLLPFHQNAQSAERPGGRMAVRSLKESPMTRDLRPASFSSSPMELTSKTPRRGPGHLLGPDAPHRGVGHARDLLAASLGRTSRCPRCPTSMGGAPCEHGGVSHCGGRGDVLVVCVREACTRGRQAAESPAKLRRETLEVVPPQLVDDDEEHEPRCLGLAGGARRAAAGWGLGGACASSAPDDAGATMKASGERQEPSMFFPPIVVSLHLGPTNHTAQGKARETAPRPF